MSCASLRKRCSTAEAYPLWSTSDGRTANGLPDKMGCVESSTYVLGAGNTWQNSVASKREKLRVQMEGSWVRCRISVHMRMDSSTLQTTFHSNQHLRDSHNDVQIIFII